MIYFRLEIYSDLCQDSPWYLTKNDRTLTNDRLDSISKNLICKKVAKIEYSCFNCKSHLIRQFFWPKKMVFYATISTHLSENSTSILTFCSISTAAALFYGTPILFYGTSYVWQSLILDMKNALFLVPFASSKPRNCFCCVWHSWLAVQQIATQCNEIISKGELLLSWNISSFFKY